MRNPFRYFNSSPEVIHGDDVHPLSTVAAAGRGSAVRTRDRYLLRNGAVLDRFGPMFAAEIRKRRVRHRSYSNWRWHWTRSSSKGKMHHLWRAVDHEGEVLEVFATERRDRRAALKFLKRAMKRYGRPGTIVTDRLRSYGTAIKAIGIVGRQECGRWLNNRAENSHQPFRRREGAMAKFRDIRTLQKFAAVQASNQNHFHEDRHLNRRNIFKQKRSVALAEWRQLAA